MQWKIFFLKAMNLISRLHLVNVLPNPDFSPAVSIHLSFPFPQTQVNVSWGLFRRHSGACPPPPSRETKQGGGGAGGGGENEVGAL